MSVFHCLLRQMDPADPLMRKTVDAWRQHFTAASERNPGLKFWLNELDDLEASPPRMIAPWRVSHTDDPIMTDMFYPDFFPESKRVREAVELES